MKILLTGVAGFIGSHVAEGLLRRGHVVVGLDNFNDHYNPGLKWKNIELASGFATFNLVEGDVGNIELLEDLFGRHGFDSVIHLAAHAGVRSSFHLPEIYERVNVGGSLNILNAIVKHGKPNLVFASSSSVYGLRDCLPWNEDDEIGELKSPYAITKHKGELLCKAFHQRDKLNITCLRFFTVYGPRQRPDMAISRFLRAIHTEQAITIFGDGSTRRDFTFVDDVVSGVMLAAEHPFPFEIINIGGSMTISLLELVQLLGKITNKSPKIQYQPIEPGDLPFTWADTSKALSMLGYMSSTKPRHGLELQWRWFLENGGSTQLNLSEQEAMNRCLL